MTLELRCVSSRNPACPSATGQNNGDDISTAGIGGITKYDRYAPTAIHEPNGNYTLLTRAMVAEDNHITRDADLLLDFTTFVTLFGGVSLVQALNPTHTHRTLRDVKNAVYAFANYRPRVGTRQGNFRRRTMAVLTDTECYVPRVAP